MILIIENSNAAAVAPIASNKRSNLCSANIHDDIIRPVKPNASIILNIPNTIMSKLVVLVVLIVLLLAGMLIV